MSDQEQNQQTAEQEASAASAEFLAGFDAVRNSDEQHSPESAPVEDAPAQEVEPESKQDAPGDTGKGEPDEPNGESEEPMFFGMTESQVKSLLERSARVDEIENQLRKAHGKIGELNSHLQNLTQKPTQQAPAEAETGDLGEFESDFPEVVAIARKTVMDAIKGLPAQAGASQDPAEIEKAINIAVMDATHDGWRDTVSSQDFALWIATQPEDVQVTFNTTNSAKELGRIIKSFDGWKDQVKDRGNRNKQRLEQALIPSGNTARVAHAPTPHDEFLAGFNSVRNQR